MTHLRRLSTLLLVLATVAVFSSYSAEGRIGAVQAADANAKPDGGKLTLHARTRVETEPDSGRFHTVTQTVHWDPKKTAVVVCDMWNEHWCRGATRRVAEMAGRMNDVIAQARKQGVLIIHCPSGTMEHYKDTPQRKLAQQAPQVKTRTPLKGWCHLNKEREGKLPIDDRDGGCDCQPACKTRKAWNRQIDTIQIAPGDAVTDSAEAYYLMKQRGIENVIVMGVHTNMCVLGRPFSIRQMIYQGQNVVLMRDMTDTMYNSRSAPFVSHFTGTDLVVEHIEKHWCPTVTSADLLGGKPFRFSNDKRPHLVIITAEQEYRTNETLPPFAVAELGKDFRISHVFANVDERNDLPGIEVLDEADVVLISVRRRVPPKAQFDVVRRFIAAGKPVIGIRTASHAFSLGRGRKPPAGHDAWDEFDAEILGGNYHGHHGSKGPQVTVRAADGAGGHPILDGVDVKTLVSGGSLYKVSPLAESTTPLLIGSIPGADPEPVAWTNTHKYGGRVFYTSMGYIDDFKLPAFRRLLKNGVYWAAGLIGTKTSADSPVHSNER